MDGLLNNLFVVQKRQIRCTEMDDLALTSDIEGRGSRKYFVKWKFRRTINYTALRCRHRIWIRYKLVNRVIGMPFLFRRVYSINKNVTG